jgi:nucleoside-diphosphate-sugar epimerase
LTSGGTFWTGTTVLVTAGEEISDGTAASLGARERMRMVDAVRMVRECAGHKAEIKFRPEMPTGPLSRVADNSLAKRPLGWEPRALFRDGLKRTVDWYYWVIDRDEVKRILERMLTEW